MTNSCTQFKSGDNDEKIIYTPPDGCKYGMIYNLVISTFLPSLPTLRTPEKGLLTLAEEWDERYSEFIKAGAHRRLGIYFKYPDSPDLIRRFGILLFNKSPAEDSDLLAMLITRPKNFKVESGTIIYGKIESATYGGLTGNDCISVWVDAFEQKKTSYLVSMWK